jgi:protein-L-isoaspartate(D-aspartate) O-methyltransferase
MNYLDARRRMVDSQVRTNDVTNPAIQRAFEAIAREDFLPPEFSLQAYAEREICYAPGRSLITARDLAKLLAALDPRRGDLALDAATGCGYASAILSRLVEMVVAVEPDEALCARAQENLEAAGVVNAAVVHGAAEAGAAKQGPFDLILVANAIENEPTALLAQLKDGGRLGAIWRRNGVSKGCVWRKAGDSVAATEVFDASAAVIAPGFMRKKSFAF